MRIRYARGVLAGAVIVVAVPGTWHPLAQAAPPAGAGAGGKITICHRTHSVTNPYRKITVSISGANGSSPRDHTHHSGSPFDAEFAYPPQEKSWGDIIPSTLNWTTAGQALYASASCVARSAQEFYNIEIEAGESPADILEDLADQDASDDEGVVIEDLTYTGTDPEYLPPVDLPPVELPPVELPPVELPPVELPPVELPPVELPPVELPPVELPPVELPPVELPPVELPPVELPPVELPPVELPPVELPPVELPPVELPPVELPPAEVPGSAPATRALTAFVWLDRNGDGRRNQGEPGIGGVPVSLDGLAVGRTAADGRLTTLATRLPHVLRAEVPESMVVSASSDGRRRPLVDAAGEADFVWWGVRSRAAVGSTVIELPTGGRPPVATAPEGGAGIQLPVTGAPAQTLVLAASFLLLAGTGSLWVVRRRRPSSG